MPGGLTEIATLPIGLRSSGEKLNMVSPIFNLAAYPLKHEKTLHIQARFHKHTLGESEGVSF